MSLKQYTGVCPEATGKDGAVSPLMSATVEYDFHEEADISEICEVFTIPVVTSVFVAKGIIALQGWIRGQLRAGKAEADIQAAIAAGKWKLGIAKPKKSASEKALELTAPMSDEEFDAYLARLQEARKAAAQKK